MIKIVASSKYKRQARKLLKKNPQLASAYSKALSLLTSDMGSPSLRLHKLKADGDIWAVSVAPNIRLVFMWEGEVLYLLKIGSHDEVY